MRLLQPSLLIGLLIIISSCSTDKKEAKQQSQEQAAPHHKKIRPLFDIMTLTNQAAFNLPEAALNLLAENGFVVLVPGSNPHELSTLYNENRSSNLPSFVTADAILHTYHLIFDQLLQQLETASFLPALKKLATKLLTTSLSEYKQLSQSPLKDAALRATAFCAVPARILGKTPPLPTEIEALVHQELSLIEAANTRQRSPLFNYKITPLDRFYYQEDYTQYIPRGHYTRSDKLKRYFKAMMWLGRMTFLFKHDEQIITALILCRILQKTELKKLWRSLYQPTAFLVGPSDGATLPDLYPAAQAAFGKTVPLKALASPHQLAAFKKSLKKLPQPAINSLVTANELSGATLMGQRFVVDAFIFQNLIHPAIKTRFLPQALDIPAALGSEESITILREMKETKAYPSYLTKYEAIKTKIAAYSPAEWNTTIAGGWIYTLKSLVAPLPKEAPLFMQNSAWARKQLQCFMGSWAELKHDTILYAQQAYSLALSGRPDLQKPQEKPDTRGFVEPQPELYARLLDLTAEITKQLIKFKLPPTHINKAFKELTELVTLLKTIAEKELRDEERSPQEYATIEGIGATLTALLNRVISNPKDALTATIQEPEPAALVADVATAPELGTVLEVAIGNISEIYVIVSIDGKPRITKGGCFSFYEFHQPMAKRLTDEAWRTILNKRAQSAQPEWVKPFTITV